MGLRRELKEEYEEELLSKHERRIEQDYYTDPDESMRGFASSIMYRNLFGEYEPNDDIRKMKELELENLLKNESGND